MALLHPLLLLLLVLHVTLIQATTSSSSPVPILPPGGFLPPPFSTPIATPTDPFIPPPPPCRGRGCSQTTRYSCRGPVCRITICRNRDCRVITCRGRSCARFFPRPRPVCRKGCIRRCALNGGRFCRCICPTRCAPGCARRCFGRFCRCNCPRPTCSGRSCSDILGPFIPCRGRRCTSRTPFGPFASCRGPRCAFARFRCFGRFCRVFSCPNGIRGCEAFRPCIGRTCRFIPCVGRRCRLPCRGRNCSLFGCRGGYCRYFRCSGVQCRVLRCRGPGCWKLFGYRSLRQFMRNGFLGKHGPGQGEIRRNDGYRQRCMSRSCRRCFRRCPRGAALSYGNVRVAKKISDEEEEMGVSEGEEANSKAVVAVKTLRRPNSFCRSSRCLECDAFCTAGKW